MAGMGRCVQRPVMVLGGCEFLGHTSLRTFNDLVGSIAGAKPFIGAKFDLKKGKFVLGQGKENLFLV